MTFGKREPDSFAAKNVAYSFVGTLESASVNARAFVGLSDRGAVKIEAANPVTADPVSDRAAGPPALPRCWCRTRSTTSSMPAGDHLVQDHALGVCAANSCVYRWRRFLRNC